MYKKEAKIYKKDSNFWTEEKWEWYFHIDKGEWNIYIGD